jgi:hypothetical protein
MNKSKSSLCDTLTRVSAPRAGRVGADCKSSLDSSRIGRFKGYRALCLLMGACIGLLVAQPAYAQSCDEHCPQLREEGFSGISNPDGSVTLCCCLSDEKGKVVSQPAPKCEELP